MFEYRWVKTSKSDFLELRENNVVVLKLTNEVKPGDIGVLFTANNTIHIYALVDGGLVAPDLYSATADRCRTLITQAAQGSLRIMGQIWVNRNTQGVSIANVTLGAAATGRFAFSKTGHSNLKTLGFNEDHSARKLTRLVKHALAEPA